MTSTQEERIKMIEDLGHKGFWKNWMPIGQRQAIGHIIAKSEEREWFIQRLKTLRERIEQMPKTYDTNGQEDPVAHLKYFGGPVTAYITEKDVGDNLDGPWTPDTEQIQAYGRIGILPSYPEMGYVGIQELIENGIELDLHFEPTPISQIKAKEV